MDRRFKKRVFFLALYLLFAILPVYWMVNMSFKTNEEILGVFSMWPRDFTLEHYRTILTDPYLWTVTLRTVVFAAVCVITTLVVGLAIALLLQRLGRAMRLVLSVGLLMAWATPARNSATRSGRQPMPRSPASQSPAGRLCSTSFRRLLSSRALRSAVA